MATVTVTKAEIGKILEPLSLIVDRLNKCSGKIGELMPDGFVYYKAPDALGIIKDLTLFAARIDAEIENARLEKRFGVTGKVAVTTTQKRTPKKASV